MPPMRRSGFAILLACIFAAAAARAELVLPEPDPLALPAIRTVTPPPAEALHPAARSMSPIDHALRPTLIQPVREPPMPDTRLRLPPNGVAGLQFDVGVIKPVTAEVEGGEKKKRRSWAERMAAKLGTVVEAVWKPTALSLLALAVVGGLILRSWKQRLAWQQREFEPV